MPIIENKLPSVETLAKERQRMEKVQRQCEQLRQVDLRLKPVTYRKYRSDMCETYTLLHGHYKLDPANLIVPSTTPMSPTQTAELLHGQKLGRFFFLNRFVDGLNRLRSEAVMAPTLTSFKTRLAEQLLVEVQKLSR